jgi:hypothetical protein
MAYEPKDNTGSVFTNKDKKTDKHPDRTGSARIGGVDYWVDGWINQDRNGKPYLSLKFKQKDGAARVPEPAERKPVADDMEDSIPF